MIISFQINDENYRINSSRPLDISIPLDFNGPQPNAYGVEKAISKACEAGDLVGDTRRGGSCNFEQVTFIPHCNGTHTECVGHITRERISVYDSLKDVFIPAVLISVKPEKADEAGETYPVKVKESDRLITRRSVENALERQAAKNQKSKVENQESLIVRTLPNDEGKRTRTYLEHVPPFFSTEAAEFIAAKGVKHLLVDLPSIDRIFDEGKLSNHRTFWGVEPGVFELNAGSRVNNTITELIFVPDEVEDGTYLLNLQIAPFSADAAPSRPILFKISE